jgi:phage protein U
MFGSLGAITFQVVNSPQKITSERGSHYEVLPVIEGTPVVEWIYDELQRIKLEFFFHQQFTNPAAAEKALEALQVSHRAVPLVYGNGDNQGNFVILKLERTDVWRADDGTPIAMQMVAELLEYGATLPVGAPSAIPTNTPGLIGSSSTQQQTTLYSGVLSVPAPNLPALPAGLQGADIPASQPLYPTIPKLPYAPAVGSLTPSSGFLNIPLSTATRWGS